MSENIDQQSPYLNSDFYTFEDEFDIVRTNTKIVIVVVVSKIRLILSDLIKFIISYLVV
jgi:hypothetical protein